ncbi:hypothetical protein BU16DRAFT_576457 [Lophium mytilinum]|uniref:Heterokaryon incompatibility domain-containing protein n=1 Tax=Lophium mytilinum TaxID=390894 RepID=A0A6A6RD15_9PEZI|nr:hypothetical protein BU16DRAFT_576457 [Lophium mytilinum]
MMDEWPAIGSSANLSLSAHASQLKKEINSLLDHDRSASTGEGSAVKQVPYDVVKELCGSVIGLLEKIECQPTLEDLAKAIRQIDQTTKTILTDVRAGKNSSESRPPTMAAGTTARTLPVKATIVTPVVEPPAPTTEETLELLGFNPQSIASMMKLPPKTLEKIIEAKKRGMERVQVKESTAGTVAPNSGTVKFNAQALATRTSSALHGAGGSSKILLQSQDPPQGPVHEKVYQSLAKDRNEIRLIKLSPSPDPNYDVGCELIVASLDQNPKYKALSYTWGNPNDTVPITLNGQRFDVTRNLKKALQSLRALDTDTPYWYWVDAICINQVDIEERMHQVGLMREIFERPTEVVVWLGETQASPGDELWDSGCFNWTGDASDVPKINSILSFAAALADTYPEKSDPRSANPLVLGFCFMRLLAGDVHLSDIPLLQNINLRSLCLIAFRDLVSQAWWNRIWVVQEVILPPTVTVIFGHFTAPLQLYADAYSNLRKHKLSCCASIDLTNDKDKSSMGLFTQKMKIITESANLWRRKEKTSLLTLLRLYFTKDATDPRDKVYGLLGLVTDWGSQDSSPKIKPDYAITSSVLFQDVAVQSILGSGTLDILVFRTEGMYHGVTQQLRKILTAAAYPPGTSLPSGTLDPDNPVHLTLPSWTPNWETINQRGFEIQTTERINRISNFNACASCPAPAPDILYTESPVLTRTRVLTLFGIRVGKIAEATFPFLVTNMSALKTDKLPLPIYPANSPLSTQPYVAGGTQYDATWRALCADTMFTSAEADAKEETSKTGPDTKNMFRRATEEGDLASIQAWRKWIAGQASHGVRQPPALKDFPSAEDYARVVAADNAIRSAVLSRSFFRTDTGYMGLGTGASPSHELFILLGSRTPHLLRSLGEMKVEGKGVKTMYMLAGEAYVPGIMDGEIIRKWVGEEGKGMDVDGLRKAGLDVQELLVI